MAWLAQFRVGLVLGINSFVFHLFFPYISFPGSPSSLARPYNLRSSMLSCSQFIITAHHLPSFIRCTCFHHLLLHISFRHLASYAPFQSFVALHHLMPCLYCSFHEIPHVMYGCWQSHQKSVSSQYFEDALGPVPHANGYWNNQ